MARREAYLLIPRGGVLRGWTCQTHVRKTPASLLLQLNEPLIHLKTLVLSHDLFYQRHRSITADYLYLSTYLPVILDAWT